MLILDAKEFGLSGDLSFADISSVVDSYSMIVIGVMGADSQNVILNPSDSQIFSDLQNKKVIVIK